MRAAYVDTPNATDALAALQIGDRPDPEVPEGWVRIRMAAASLNWHDKFTLHGMGAQYDRPEEFPMVLGCDGIGRLDDGSRVIIYNVVNHPEWIGNETLDPDRQTVGEAIQGTFAQYCVVPRRNAVPLPEGISDEGAAVLGAAWLTAYRMLFTHAKPRPGQIMLVQGATGGIATALIQMGKAAGIRVWVCGRTAEKRAIAEKLGAERTFASGEALPEPAHFVFEPVGTATFSHSLQSVGIGGKIVVCGFLAGAFPQLDLGRVFIDQITIQGSYAGTLQELKDMLEFVTATGLVPYVGHVFPLERAREAFELLENGNFLGKIVLDLN